MRILLRLAVLLLAGSAVAGQISADTLAVGKGFILGPAGTVTAAAAEILSGRRSIKGSYFGTSSYTPILSTEASIFSLASNQTYRVTFRYRVVTAPSANFEVLFYSPTAAARATFLPSESFRGGAGSSGTITLRRTLGAYSDYRVIWNVTGTGEVVIDDIQILQDATNQLVAAEDGEGPRINPGPLNFQITEAKAFSPTVDAPGLTFSLRSATAQDLDGDGSPEIIITFTTYPEQVPLPPIILRTTPMLSLETLNVFPGGAPTLRHSALTLFGDLDGDGLKDMVFADAGLDHPPWTGSGIGIGLNRGRGVYDNVSSLVPADLQATRSYALAVADLNGDGRADVLLPDQSGTKPAILRWNGRAFTAQLDWIDHRLWASPTNLGAHTWVGFADLDKDGRQDLIVTGNSTQPAWRLLFGSPLGFTTQTLVQLPDGPFGHSPFSSWSDPATPIVQGGDIGPVVVADFNNDGRLDLFALEEQAIHVQAGAITDTNVPNYADLLKNGGTYYGDIALQVFINDGARQFTENSAAASSRNLGRRIYQTLTPIDMNNDGFVDIVGIFQTKPYGSDPGNAWGTTFFFNDGMGALQVIDGTNLLPVTTTNPPRDERWSLGSFVPTAVGPGRTDGVIIDPLSNGTLNVYKVISNLSIGASP